MSGIAGYGTTVEVSTDSGSNWTALGGFNQVDPQIQLALEDVTEFGDEAIDRIGTLFDTQLSLSGQELYGDAGQGVLRTQFLSRGQFLIRWLNVDGYGFSVPVRASNYQAGSQVAGKVSLSVTLQGAGSKPTAITP